MRFISLSLLFFMYVNYTHAMEDPEQPVPQSMEKANISSLDQKSVQFTTGLFCCLTTGLITNLFLPNDYVSVAVFSVNGLVAASYVIKEGYSAYYDLKLGMSAEETFKTTLLEKKNQ